MILQYNRSMRLENKTILKHEVIDLIYNQTMLTIPKVHKNHPSKYGLTITITKKEPKESDVQPQEEKESDAQESDGKPQEEKRVFQREKSVPRRVPRRVPRSHQHNNNNHNNKHNHNSQHQYKLDVIHPLCFHQTPHTKKSKKKKNFFDRTRSLSLSTPNKKIPKRKNSLFNWSNKKKKKI